MTSNMEQQLDFHDELLKALDKVDRPSAVCTSGDIPLMMPGLKVDGLGVLSLPFGKTLARKLIKQCHQAPYGKGTETLVDTDVRRTWELDPDQFQLTNPKWEELVEEIIAKVQRELGLEDRKLKAHLYKLLVYEKGGFFLPHRDGEKLDRMVATLVIGLPSVCEGGELIVSHDGRQHEIAFTGATSGYEVSYAAFYADCQHEVRPLRSGYRLCLTYNVTLAKSRSKKGINAPSYGSTIVAISKLLDDWRKNEARQKIAVILDHRYTQDSLSMDTLKGIDQARAEVLFEAAEQADCVAHLALVTLWQSGEAKGEYDEYSYRGGFRGYHRSDAEDDYGETGEDYEMGEIYDHSLSANHWSDHQGKKVRLGEIHLDEEDFVSESPLDDGDPNSEDFEGFTGNAGMTLERWYHRAAIVIWPRDKHFSVLCGAGTDAAIGGLQPLVNRLKRMSTAKREEKRRECLTFAAAIIDSWQASGRSSWNEAEPMNRGVFVTLLQELDDPDLFRRFLSQVVVDDGGMQLDNSFGKFGKQHGWSSFEAELTSVIEATTAKTINRNADLLATLCLLRDRNTERMGFCTRLAERMVKALEAFDQQLSENNWQLRAIDRSALLISLVKAMLAIDAVKPLSRLIDHALTSVDKYDLTGAHLAAIFSLKSRIAKLPVANDAISHWLGACRKELENRTVLAPQKPTDYRRADELSCGCGDCAALSAFLANPDQKQGRFPLAKKRRQHLHQIIDGNHCDLTHVTERRGSPFTLVCTKTTASYEAACKTHERNLKNLSRIIALEKKTS
ncbi:MAG: 2OG-Fe(II) oxygenase [Pseudomonadota bacterium]|nr:2OG-Fe(II) oxygenase [Pseudomonadota bacterium]